MKYPFTKFYPADFLADTTDLSPGAVGTWMRILCHLWHAQPKGALTLTMAKWAVRCNTTPDVLAGHFDELQSGNPPVAVIECDDNGLSQNHNTNITVSCRRILRDAKALHSNYIRQRRFRVTHRCNACDNGNDNGNDNGQKLEVRSQKSEARITTLAASPASQVTPPPESLEATKQEILPQDKRLTWCRESSRILGFIPEDFVAWAPAFPALDLKQEIAQAEGWLKANPTQLKKNYAKFLFNWFTRSQQRGGNAGGRLPLRPPRAQAHTFPVYRGNDEEIKPAQQHPLLAPKELQP